MGRLAGAGPSRPPVLARLPSLFVSLGLSPLAGETCHGGRSGERALWGRRRRWSGRGCAGAWRGRRRLRAARRPARPTSGGAGADPAGPSVWGAAGNQQKPTSALETPQPAPQLPCCRSLWDAGLGGPPRWPWPPSCPRPSPPPLDLDGGRNLTLAARLLGPGPSPGRALWGDTGRAVGPRSWGLRCPREAAVGGGVLRGYGTAWERGSCEQRWKQHPAITDGLVASAQGLTERHRQLEAGTRTPCLPGFRSHLGRVFVLVFNVG